MTSSGRKIRRVSTGKSGFSIAEILVVVAIIGLILGVSVPAFNHVFKSFKLKTSGRQVVGAMQIARQRSITRTRDYYVFFDESPSGSPNGGPNAFTVVESNLQNGVALAGAASTVFWGPNSTSVGCFLVATAGSTFKPNNATAAPLPTETLAGTINKTDRVAGTTTDLSSSLSGKPAVVFYPNGTVKTAGGVWVQISRQSGTAYNWMEINSTSVGRISTSLGLATSGP